MIKDASAGARWTLAGAVATSVVVLGVAVYLVGRPDPEPPPLAVAGPWEPPVVAGSPIPWVSESSRPPATKAPVSRRPTTPPPARKTTPPPRTTTPTAKPPVPPPNLSLRGDGGADGSTKAERRSFKDVRDGDLETFWSPVGETGEISVKWPVPVTVGRIVIRERGERRIGGWQVRNHDNDALLASGSGAGEIRFRAVALRKVTFVIVGSDGTPRVAEYEAFSR